MLDKKSRLPNDLLKYAIMIGLGRNRFPARSNVSHGNPFLLLVSYCSLFYELGLGCLFPGHKHGTLLRRTCESVDLAEKELLKSDLI